LEISALKLATDSLVELIDFHNVRSDLNNDDTHFTPAFARKLSSFLLSLRKKSLRGKKRYFKENTQFGVFVLGHNEADSENGLTNNKIISLMPDRKRMDYKNQGYEITSEWFAPNQGRYPISKNKGVRSDKYPKVFVLE